MSEQHNPYAPPSQQVAPVPMDEGEELAGRGARLIAAFVDSILLAIVLVPTQFVLGVYDGFPDVTPASPVEGVLWTAASFAMMLVIQGRFLATRAQTLGKALMGIKMVDLEGNDASFQTLVLKRELPRSVVAAIPYIGGVIVLVDVLMIFARDRRCLHDHVAGTRVVRA